MWIGILAICVGSVAWWVWPPALNGPIPFTISKDTTWFTEPLLPDSRVDYVAAVNARLSEGVTPDNNAAVPLMQVFGVKVVSNENRGAFFKMLSVLVPIHGEGLIRYHHQVVEDYVKANAVNDELQPDLQLYWDQKHQAQKQPWSREEFPLVAKWLDDNAETLSLTLEASRRPRLYFPILPAEFLFTSGGVGISIGDFRELVGLLAARAMLAVHEKRVDDAIQDLLACHRFAALFGQQPDLIETLGSYGMDFTAGEAVRALIWSETLTKRELTQFRKEFESLPPLPRLSEKIDLGRRLDCLDVICKIATRKLDSEIVSIQEFQEQRRLSSVDWDSILKRTNEHYDEMVSAVELPSFAARQSAINKYYDRLENEYLDDAHNPEWVSFLQFQFSRDVATRRIGIKLLGQLTPSIDLANMAETRAQTRRDLTRIALALAEYKLDHGNYPPELSELSPKYLSKIPLDAFIEQPLKYQRQDAGYLLYSQGANGKDDQGVMDGDGADDIAISMPKPPET